MKRELFVFAGQSNMMGASVYPPSREPKLKNSFEYKHKLRRLGIDADPFVPAGYPVGEFSYIDTAIAYSPENVNEKGESYVDRYDANTHFCPSMSNLDSEEEKTVLSFSSFSEATARHGVSLAPLLAERWETLGRACAYAHIAKGGVSINYYFTKDMAEEYTRLITEYNKSHGTDYPISLSSSHISHSAADYFIEKVTDFFKDSARRFSSDDLSDRAFLWLQGESDTKLSATEYALKMDILWEKLKSLGFTHFLCIRVDYFGNPEIWKIMKAQEDFTKKHPDAHMLTRAASYLTYPDRDESTWLLSEPEDEYKLARDSFFGFPNNHVNEKGFETIASHAAKNLYRILVLGKEPELEDEKVSLLL